MPFKKGQSGNPNGRPPGSINKDRDQLRQRINGFLSDNFEQMMEDFKTLDPKERIKVFTHLLQYGIGKIQNISETVSIERMPEEQLDEIIDRIKNVQSAKG